MLPVQVSSLTPYILGLAGVSYVLTMFIGSSMAGEHEGLARDAVILAFAGGVSTALGLLFLGMMAAG